MKGLLVTDLETSKIEIFLKKHLLWPIGKKICMAPIMTNDSILDASKLNSAEAGLDRKEEKVKNRIFREFSLIFRYLSSSPPKFLRYFCSD